jgi:DNA-binding NarL/FixJ family response regulator
MEPRITPYTSPGGATGRPRLLIADDDRVVRSALSLQLGNAFELVGAARDAAEAVDLANQHQPDVAVIDVQMPAGGGPYAAAGIAACSPSTVILALSVDESHHIVTEMINAGAMTYVRKGASAQQLVDVLMRCIEAQRRLAAAT